MTEKQLSVLLVDDEQSLREPLAKHLRAGYGYHVDTAPDAFSAWRLATEADPPYDVTLIDDLLIPERGSEPEPIGIELMRKIRERCSETECIVFTGWGMERALEALQAGAYRYLAKPLNLDELGMTIRMAAEHRRLKRQLETTKQEKEWLQTFLEIGRATTSVLELNEVLEQVHKQIGRLMDASCLDVILYDESSKTLQFKLGYDKGKKEATWERRFTRGQGFTDWVIEHCRPLLIKDFPNETIPVPPYQRGEPSRSWLGVPLVARDRVIGAITVQSYEPCQFDETHQQILSTIASQVANAISKARLYETQRQQADELARIHRASATLFFSTAADFPTLVQNIVEAVLREFDQANCSLLLLRPATGELERIGVAGPYSSQVTQARLTLEGPGLVPLAVRTKEIVNVPDVSVHPDYVANWSQARSEMAVPLKVGDRVIGVLDVQSIQPDAFSLFDERPLSTFAERAALALENARLFNEVQQRVAELEALQQQVNKALDTAKAVAQVTVLGDHRAALLAVAQGTKEVTGCDAVTLFIYNQLADRLDHPPTMVGVHEPDKASRYGEVLSDSIVYEMLQRDEPYIAENLAQDSLFRNRRFAREEGIESCVAIPLRAVGQTVGVMFVNYRSRHRFTAQELTNINLFADQAIVAIRNAQLYQVEQQHGQALKAIQETSAAVSAVLDLDVLLPMITDKAAGIFTAPATSLMLWDDFGANLVIRAAHGLGTAYQQEQRITRSVVDKIIAQRGLGPHVFGIHQEPIGKPELVEQEGLYTTLVAPLLIGKDLIGILNIYSRDAPRRFTDREIELGAVFANHAAIAIKNAQLFQQANERLQESGIMQRVALALASTVELEALLDQVVAAALQLTHTHSGSVLLWDSRTQTFTRTFRKIGLDKRLQLYQSGVRREGGIARAIIDRRQPIVIPETLQDPRVHPDTIHKGRRALVGVPLLSHEEAIGVLFVKSTEPRDFPERQVKLLEAFASQAAVAIEKADRYEELRRTKGLVGARTAVAWMGMVSSTWRHNVGNYATTIQDLVELARRDLAKGSAPDKIRARLSHITKMVNQIREAPITAPLQAEEGVGSVSINALLQERIMQLGGRDSFEQVKLTLDLSLDDATTVRASPHWLRRAFDIIIENAVDAMSHSATRELAILTRPADDKVEIIIQDTGPGVPEAVLPVLLQTPIPKAKGSKGLGVGLLMAHTIIQTYGGDLQLASTGPSGTTWFVWLPVEREESTHR